MIVNKLTKCIRFGEASAVLLVFSSVCAPASAAQPEAIQQLKAVDVYAVEDDLDYASQKVNLAGFSSSELNKIPASIRVVDTALLRDRHIKVLSDLSKADASLGDSYAAIGYYQNVVSRGFGLDLTSSYLLNGHTIRGEQTVMLENKAQVEILKGISAIQSGMSTPGGVVNYVSKRPKDIRQLRVDADSNGGTLAAFDLGGFLGAEQTLGYRLNFGAESIHPYVEHANGKRYFGALALDWNLSDQSQLQFDLETQYHRQPSVPGYQPLNGKLPTNTDWKRRLGYARNAPDVATHSQTAQIKYNYQFNPNWNGFLSASHSKVVIDDRSYFPWGCYADLCQGGEGVFDANGNYDLYNYVQPDDTRKTNQYKAGLTGAIDTAAIKHLLSFELSHSDKTRDRYQALNQVIGTGNIYSDEIIFNLDRPESVGNRYRSFTGQQQAIYASDRIAFNPQVSAIVGLKWLNIDEKAYRRDGAVTRHSDFDQFLPQFALMYAPWTNTNLYASYAKGLSDGQEAPWYTSNADSVLAPIHSRQYEIGIKQKIGAYWLGLTVFDLSQDHQYARPNGSEELIFVAEGKQRNRGAELALNGELSPQLHISSSLAYIRARLKDISYAAYTGHQSQNQPKWRLSSQLSYSLPQVEGLRLLAGVLYSSSKYADKTGTLKVDAYTVVDLGAAYQFRAYAHDASLRFNLENVFNQKYWRDVGAAYGDDYLFLGTPRTAKLSLSVDF